jgi:hypothetical protein
MSCCGASAAHKKNFDLSIALPARNLIARGKGRHGRHGPLRRLFQTYQLGGSPEGRQRPVSPHRGRVWAPGIRRISIRKPIDVILNEIGVDAARGENGKTAGGTVDGFRITAVCCSSAGGLPV